MKKRNILLIDHGEDGRATLKTLQELGHEVTYSENRTEGAAIALAKTFDIVLIDPESPGRDLNGVQAMRQIKQKKPDLKVVMVAKDESQKDWSINKGADGFYTKPLSKESLIELFGGEKSGSSKIISGIKSLFKKQ